MGALGDALSAASGNSAIPFLKPLIDELGIEKSMSKAVLAGLVIGTLRNNNCGVSQSNEEQIKQRLIEGVCDYYAFEVADLAGSWDNDLLWILAKNEPTVNMDTFYKEHVWPFLRKNEVIPGVIMKT